MNCDRREFLKILGIAGATGLIANESIFAEPSESIHGNLRTHAILNDGTRCIGCHSCEKACREYNNLPKLEKDRDGNLIYPNKLDCNTYSRVEIRKVKTENGEETFYRRHMCFHCEHPSCASACPVGALTKSPEGPVYYRAERCIGCRYCINACPFSIPKYEWYSPKPFVRKCTMCHEKVERGEATSCASVCPTGAITFGYRNDLIREAHERIKANPGRYHDYVFGEREVGGTCVMYLSSSAIPLSDFGFPLEVGTQSYPSLTWAALSRVPGIALYVVAWVSLVYFITHRRIPLEITENSTEAVSEDEN